MHHLKLKRFIQLDYLQKICKKKDSH